MVIFKQGDHSDDVFILVDGGVEILVNNVKVAEIKEKNTYFGELSILTGGPRSATVRTIAPSSFSVIPGARLEAAIQRNPSIGFKLATLLASRLKQTNQKAVAATEKAEKLEFRLKALGDDINVFLSQRKNPLIADLCRNLVLVEFHKEDGTVNVDDLVK